MNRRDTVKVMGAAAMGAATACGDVVPAKETPRSPAGFSEGPQTES